MRVATIVGAVLALMGCQPQELPGEPLGTYAINGALEENTCGQTALPANDPLTFDVQIRVEGTNGTWIVDNPPGFEGVVDEEGAFLFGVESFSTVIEPGSRMMRLEQPSDYILGEVSASQAEVGCTLSIVEQIDGSIHRRLQADGGVDSIDEGAADPEAADLEGENRIDMAPMPGSDCGALLATQGGPFLALPCYARYTLRGELVETQP